MLTIWKFPLETTGPTLAGRHVIRIPEPGLVHAAAAVADRICLWAVVDPTRPRARHVIDVIGTGEILVDDVGLFLDTVIMPPYVWHVFCRRMEDG